MGRNKELERPSREEQTNGGAASNPRPPVSDPDPTHAIADVVSTQSEHNRFSHRLEEKLHEHDVQGERAIAFAQGLICFFVLSLHYLARFKTGLDMINPWVVLTLSAIILSSAVRMILMRLRRPPMLALDALNVFDIATFLLLIWSYQFAYQTPAGGVLKAPSFVLIFALVAVRALKSHPRAILTAGGTAIGGWFVLVMAAAYHDGPTAVTRDYVDHLASFRILFGAEVEKIVALAAVVTFLATATHKSRSILGKSAHVEDYAEALGAARRHLNEATLAREKAETALAKLDNREAELMEQNQRFDAALSNMSPGLCMFDRNHNLVVCNKTYLEMYRIPRDLSRPGTSFREIILHRIRSGMGCGDNPQEFLEERLAAANELEPNITVHHVSDGRVISVKHQPMENGGWVATHEDITLLHKTEAHVAHMARHDALTNLPNRVQLREFMDDSLYGASDEGQSLVILLFNLDRFKEINDTLGHTLGDTLLQGIAERLSANLTDVGMIARIGGDDFAAIQFTNDPANDGVRLAEQIQGIISEPFDLDGRTFVVTTSIGIAVSPNDGTESDQLLKNADLALDRSKNSGRGAYCFFEQGMDQRLQARRQLEQDLHSAITNGEFEVHYQPQLNLARGEISGFEALVRWNSPTRGRVSPAEFIPIAEETGLIVPIGEWVLRTACTEAVRWPGDTKVAVNLSAVQLSSSNILQTVIETMASTGIPAKKLDLEVTESVLMDESGDAIGTLQRISDLGIGIALDDFGTGYSSLGYLKRFSFDKIKIDRSFVSEISKKGNNALAIVRTIAALGQSLGVSTCAEGVETQEELDLVRAEGYTEVQGYFVSRPVPAAEIPDFFAGFGKKPGKLATLA
jgi:diguanylate cyclase (GGDEF)-like protein